MAERPLCRCHDVPMYRHGPSWRCAIVHKQRAHDYYHANRDEQKKRRQRRYWENPESERARVRRHYDSLSGLEYNRLLLRRRRNKGLQRMRQRALAEDKEVTHG